MKDASIRNRGKTGTTWQIRVYALALALFMLLAVTAGGAYAAMPPAGAIIGNQATATFTDPTLGAQTVTSNTVSTTVQQVYSLSIDADLTLIGVAGGQVNFPVTLQNTGNGSENMTLSAGTLTGVVSGVTLYPDAGGFPGGTAISGPINLAAGASYNFFAVATVSGTAQAGNPGTFQVSATGSGGSSGFVTDTVNVTGNALVNITKTVNPVSGNPGTTPYTFTLAYANTGNNTASSLAITDNIPAGLTYVPGSAKWNGNALTDAAGGDPAGIDFSFNAGVLSASIISVPSTGAGSSGTLTFDVSIAAGAAAGPINNTASFTYNDGSGPVGPVNSTTATITVNQAGNVWLSDKNNAGTVFSTTDNGTSTDDTVTYPTPATQGSVIWFENILTNTGNGSDTFNLAASGSSFPAGTTFDIYNAGKTAVIAATPAVAAGADYHIWVKVTLPLNYNGGPPGYDNGGAGWGVTLTATSQFNGTVSNAVTDKLESINPAKVDVTNDNPAGVAACDNALDNCGFGAGPEAAAQTTNTVNAGATTTFTLYLNNTGPIPDTYDLTAGSTGAMAALPAGWSVVFKDGATPVTSVTVAAGGNKLITAEVSVAGSVTPTTQDIFFKAASASTLAADIKHDAVTVATIRNVTLAPATLSSNIVIGGYAYYVHTITNNGNVAETTGTVATTDGTANFSSTVYYDANGNGVIDFGENPIGNLSDIGGIAAGASIKVIVKVYANTNVIATNTNVTTLTVTPTGLVAVTAQDTSTAQAPGGVGVLKEQGLDSTCDGIAEGGFGAGSFNVNPGQCIRYRITVTNNNPWGVTGINVTDSTPTDTLSGLPTLYSGGSTSCYDGSWQLVAPAPGLTGVRAAITGSGTVQTVTTEPASCGSGAFAFNIGDLAAGASSTITFGVQVPH